MSGVEYFFSFFSYFSLGTYKIWSEGQTTFVTSVNGGFVTAHSFVLKLDDFKCCRGCSNPSQVAELRLTYFQIPDILSEDGSRHATCPGDAGGCAGHRSYALGHLYDSSNLHFPALKTCVTPRGLSRRRRSSSAPCSSVCWSSMGYRPTMSRSCRSSLCSSVLLLLLLLLLL